LSMISVIIPTLNEEHSLGITIDSVRHGQIPAEIIVVDAGSSDRTIQVAAEHRTAVQRAAVRQRAAQMNLGAASATHDILLFLHADTRLPVNGLQQIVNALSDSRVGGGGFVRRFDSPSLFLKLTCTLAELRNRTIGWHLGDQAIFVRKNLFQQLKGFAPLNQFEDLDFSRRLAGLSRLVTLRPPVISSPRRFEKDGAILRTFRDCQLTLRYFSHARPPYPPP